jgi:hypothetical protein
MIRNVFVARLYRGEVFLPRRVTVGQMDTQQKEVMPAH